MTYQELLRTARHRNAFALYLTSAIAPIFGFLYAGQAGAFWAFAAWITFVVIPRTTGMRPFGFVHRNFFLPHQLPWTMVDIILAVLCGTMIWGIGPAFCAALIGVPIVVLALILIALELDPAAEPYLEPAVAPASSISARHPPRVVGGRRGAARAPF